MYLTCPKSCDLIYKMYVRSHLNYCDIIYHGQAKEGDFDSSLTLNHQMNALERTQYQAALAVSGAWKGTNWNKSFKELEWETLDQRHWFRRLIQFYNILKDQTPAWLRLSRNIFLDLDPPIFFRTNSYQSNFYPNCFLL